MRRMIYPWPLLIGLLTLCACSGNSSGAPAPGTTVASPYGIEVIVRTGDNFATPDDVQAFVDLAAQNGVAVVNLLVKQDEDGSIQSGQVFYASALAPSAPGYAHFDVLQTMLSAAHARHIKVRAWMPQFHDQVAARKNSTWQMMALNQGVVAPYTGSHAKEYFVNPLLPAVQAYELSLIQEVTRNYAVDGIMLDWLRFDNFNMDLSADTRARYQSSHGLDPLTIDFSQDSAARQAWNEFRTDGIAAYAQQVRSTVPAALSLGVYILPPEFVEVAQDAAKFNRSVDTLAPMCYFVDWGFSVDWLWSSCLSSTAQKAGAAQIAPAMDSALTDAQYQQIFSHMRAQFPQIRTLAWFHHGRWDAARLQRIAQLSQ